MCLGLPGRIISVDGNTAVMDCWGTPKKVLLGAEALIPGDFVIEHEGSIVRRVPAHEVADTLALYETILAETLVPA